MHFPAKHTTAAEHSFWAHISSCWGARTSLTCLLPIIPRGDAIRLVKHLCDARFEQPSPLQKRWRHLSAFFTRTQRIRSRVFEVTLRHGEGQKRLCHAFCALFRELTQSHDAMESAVAALKNCGRCKTAADTRLHFPLSTVWLRNGIFEVTLRHCDLQERFGDVFHAVPFLFWTRSMRQVRMIHLLSNKSPSKSDVGTVLILKECSLPQVRSCGDFN